MRQYTTVRCGAGEVLGEPTPNEMGLGKEEESQVTINTTKSYMDCWIECWRT